MISWLLNLLGDLSSAVAHPIASLREVYLELDGGWKASSQTLYDPQNGMGVYPINPCIQIYSLVHI